MDKKPACLVLIAFSLCAAISSSNAATGKQKTLDNDPNLVGWWKFDETAGKSAADSSPHHRKGTLIFPNLQTPVKSVTLIIHDVAQVPERTFSWQVKP